MSAAECVLVNPGDSETSPPTVFLLQSTDEIMKCVDKDVLRSFRVSDVFYYFFNGIFCLWERLKCQISLTKPGQIKTNLHCSTSLEVS